MSPLPLLSSLPFILFLLLSAIPLVEKELRADPLWTPQSAIMKGSPLSEYLPVSKESLLSLLRQCTICVGGERNLDVRMHGIAMSCTGECTQCGAKFNWKSSRMLPTKNESNKEKLFKINPDFVTGAVLTSVGGRKLHQVLFQSGMSTFSTPTFHRLKKHYVIPAIEEYFYRSQAILIDEINERVSKGEKINLSGDGQFDSRGYCGAWCRYFILCADTGRALHYILMHKNETGGSSMKMEVAALERGLNELSYMIGGTEAIESIVTDRHGAVTTMMQKKFPGIKHYFDPWHFFCNITLALITGQHTFDKDPTFKQFKACTYSAPTNPAIYIPKGGRIVKRLEDMVFTAKNTEDIKSVSWLLHTSPCESINALATRYASKEYYFSRSGHEHRTKTTIVHWNFLKESIMNGSIPVVVRKRMVESPHTTEKKRQNAKREQRKLWEKLTRPVVPAEGDPNLDDEWSEEEEEEDDGVLPPLLSPQLQLCQLADQN
ncbi:hypothetical protein PRIPAC_83226 [Pristionchus pacificus]|uniref:Uncharacterized protein n=1 Tax=Pristionchus pacificus TaxID=54126 RepID=A0A2A6BKJ0_PRIPA|nr:hypothetical protein PRIPAC_83226 [Pristionchus pacificus]|eukprot:PDM66343.1 hypothetical protein PRIPAC_47760 [Pristionchus pacificus]